MLLHHEVAQHGLVLGELGARDGVGGAGEGPSGIAQGKADGLGADVQPDQPSALRERGAKGVAVSGDQRFRNVESLSVASRRTFSQNSA
jgi:hypothetical protein